MFIRLSGGESKMKKSIFLAATFFLPVFTFGQTAESAQSGLEVLSIPGEPPMLGIHWVRGFDPAGRLHQAHHGSSPLMTYHGGKIIPAAVTKNIFWGTSWAGYTGDKITGLDTW